MSGKKEFWKDRRVLVTGATGLIGSWLVEELLQERCFIVSLVRDFIPDSYLFHSKNIEKITVVHGNLEDFKLIERTLNEYEIDTVFHLGAQTIVPTANRSPLSTFEANIRGTWNLLEACRRLTIVRRFILASSDKAYGSQLNLPYTEEMPLRGEHPYDVSKSCAELLAQSYFKTYDLPLVITRCGNVYGGGDINFNRIVPGTIKSLLEKKPPIIRSDGTYTRDYFYVKDAVLALKLVAEEIERKDVRGEAFNFSNENPLSVFELVEKIMDLMKVRIKPQILNISCCEIKHQYLSSQKSKKILNWKPKYTLEEGLLETIAWYRGFFKR